MLDIDRRRDIAVRSRALGATWLSLSLHASAALLILILGGPRTVSDQALSVGRKQAPLMLWLERHGPIRGGGGHGDRTREPTPRAERLGNARFTVPPRTSHSLDDRTAREPPVQTISIPAVPEASGVREIPGVPLEVSLVGVSAGGPGVGRGAGDGDGTGLNRGFGRNTGGGLPGAGANASSPELIKAVRPNYTSPALQAGVRGIVLLDAVVMPDGSVGEVKIVRSLDRAFGLDEEAIKAVKQWRFRPGTRAGDPIAMLVSVEMLFELR